MKVGEILRTPASGPHAIAEQRLVRLLFARLSLTVLAFGIALGLDGLGREFPPAARQGLYLTVAIAFGITIVSGILLRRVQRTLYFAAAQIACDVGIVTSLVYFSGGRESVFTFLYVVVTLYGAVLFERRGAIVAATLSAMAYGVILFGGSLGLQLGLEPGTPELPVAVRGAIWGVHVGALYLVGVLASLLSSELQRTGRALDQRTSDLHRLRDLHQRTVESIMSGLLTTDGDGLVMSFNPEAERITGLTQEEALGRPVGEIIPGAFETLLRSSEVPRGSTIPRARIDYRNRRGEELFLGLAASILRDREGAQLGHVVIFQDVTEVVAMERELRSSERLAAVGEMAAKIAHEIRNPLASMSGSIQILKASAAKHGGEPESERLMEIVLRETDRLNDLITDFLQYSRPTQPELRAVDLRAELEGLVELLAGACPDAVEIELVAEPDSWVRADPDQLRQILWNLSINALEAMPEGGVLRLTVQPASSSPAQDVASIRRNGGERASLSASGCGAWLELAIADTGAGMPAAVQDRIFEPFFTTKREGTGLGLATVHRIVESHGGALSWQSHEGVGTTFRVVLPRAEASE